MRGNTVTQFVDSREHILQTFMDLQDKGKITPVRCMELYRIVGDLDRTSFALVMCAFVREYFRLFLLDASRKVSFDGRR